VVDSVDLNRVAPAADRAHLSSDAVEHHLMQRVAGERVKLGRVDLRSQPVDGRRIVGVESVRLEMAAVLLESFRDAEAAGRKRRRNRSRACNDREKNKAQRESHGPCTDRTTRRSPATAV